jgi:GTP-binding protein
VNQDEFSAAQIEAARKLFAGPCDFMRGAPALEHLPPIGLPEIAFAGRSNVGKSSLVNALTGRKTLAKTSNTPGRTQHLNFFDLGGRLCLVDMPGYGYAKTSQTNRASWSLMIKKYLTGRENLKCIFVLIDSRLKPQKVDLEFINWLGENGLPFVLVFTKADKSSGTAVQQSVDLFKKTMLESWEEVPQTFVTSSVSRTGHEDILSFIGEVVARQAPNAES